METYTVLEASKFLKISTRAVQKRCLKDKVRKGNNKYLITDEHLTNWYAEIKANELKNEPSSRTNEPTNERSQSSTQIDLHIQSLQLENEALQKEIDKLKNELSEFDISPGERIEVFTNAEYDLLQTRLQEWFTLQKEIEHKDQLFNVEKKSLSELLDHYKNQFEYQKKQSDKILEMHQTLIDTIQKQSAITIQRNIIEAKEKDVVDRDTWKPKN